MRDSKRGTIEDRSTDSVLALAFEQEKQERLLDEKRRTLGAPKDCGDCPGAQCGDCPRWRENEHWLEDRELGITWGDHSLRVDRRKKPFSIHESIGRVLDDTESRGNDDIDRDMRYGGSRTLKVCIAALSAGITAGIIRTPEDCVGVLMRVELDFQGR